MRFLPHKLSLQIDFDKPYMISQANDLNKLTVNIWDPALFIRVKDLVPIAPLSESVKVLPKIVNKETAV